MTSLVPTASWGPSITVSHSWSKSGPSRGLLRSAFNQISSHVIWLRTKSLPKVPPAHYNVLMNKNVLLALTSSIYSILALISTSTLYGRRNCWGNGFKWSPISIQTTCPFAPKTFHCQNPMQMLTTEMNWLAHDERDFIFPWKSWFV